MSHRFYQKAGEIQRFACFLLTASVGFPLDDTLGPLLRRQKQSGQTWRTMIPPDATDSFADSDPFADEPLDEAQTREIERRMNIHRLKNEANEVVGGQMTGGSESPAAPSGVLEAFWENVVAFERTPRVTTHQKLAAAGFAMPPESDLNDADLHARLWEIIGWMATQKIFLYDTDHLSDRELYTHLRDESFHEAMSDFPGMNCHTSPIGACGEADMVINFRFFADDEQTTTRGAVGWSSSPTMKCPNANLARSTATASCPKLVTDFPMEKNGKKMTTNPSQMNCYRS